MGCLPRYLPEQLSLGAGVALAGAGELEQKQQQAPGWEEEGQLAAEVRDGRCWWSLRIGAGAVVVTSPNCFAQQQEQQNDVPGSARRRSAC